MTFGYFNITFSIKIVYIIYDVTYVSLSNINCLFVLSYIKPNLYSPILLTIVLLLFQIETATRFVAHYLNITSGCYILITDRYEYIIILKLCLNSRFDNIALCYVR